MLVDVGQVRPLWAAPSPRYGSWLYRSEESELIGKHTHSHLLHPLDCGYKDLTASSSCGLNLPTMIDCNSGLWDKMPSSSPTFSLRRVFNTVTQVTLGHWGLTLLRDWSLLNPFCLCRILTSFSLVLQGASHLPLLSFMLAPQMHGKVKVKKQRNIRARSIQPTMASCFLLGKTCPCECQWSG